MAQFWQWIYYLVHISEGCRSVTQSTHGTAGTQYPVVYSGNCVQAWIIAVKSNGAVAWIIGALG